MNQIVINGDNIEVLKNYPDNYFDSVVTDPPYGLGKEPDTVELMKDWIEHGYHEIKGSGFMGKEWDAFVPQPKFWKEVFRVLKHGGHVLAFYGTRTYDWGVMAMRFAGFEVRDTIYWHYGSGFPKSHNIGKAIDKIEGNQREIIGENKYASRRPNPMNGQTYMMNETSWDCSKNLMETKGNTKWEGWGSALKPASEPIVMARKPLEKGLSIAENVLKYGTGGINIDGCRVGNEKITISQGDGFGNENNLYGNGVKKNKGEQHIGRFPANLIMTHHPECECKGLKKVKGSSCKPEDVGKGRDGDFSNGIYGDKQSKVTISHTDSEGMEEVEDWDCHEYCPIRIMDEQSGESKSSDNTWIGGMEKNWKGHTNKRIHTYTDKGGASRFFYCAKASKSERNKGLDGFEEKENKHSTYGIHSDEGLLHNGRNPENRSRTMSNFHPTVKPVKLMQYLVRLVTPPNGKVLDPFCGSGTTGIACKLEGFEFVGIEQDPEYTKIAEARITNWVEEKEEPKKESKPKEPKEQKKRLIQQNLF